MQMLHQLWKILSPHSHVPALFIIAGALTLISPASIIKAEPPPDKLFLVEIDGEEFSATEETISALREQGKDVQYVSHKGFFDGLWLRRMANIVGVVVGVIVFLALFLSKVELWTLPRRKTSLAAKDRGGDWDSGGVCPKCQRQSKNPLIGLAIAVLGVFICAIGFYAKGAGDEATALLKLTGDLCALIGFVMFIGGMFTFFILRTTKDYRERDVRR